MDSASSGLVKKVSGILMSDAWGRVSELKKEIRRLRRTLEFIAEPSEYVLPAEAWSLKSIAEAALKERPEPQ